MIAGEFRAEALKARLAEANATIAVARRALDEGKIVNLEGLEAHVDETCHGIVELPRSEGQELRPAMLALIDGLDQLSKALDKERVQTKVDIDKLSDRQRGHSAYLKSGKS